MRKIIWLLIFLLYSFYVPAQLLATDKKDNGKGFDVENSNLKKAPGLGDIKKRIKYFNGHFNISSTLNEGTTINIKLDV